MQNNRLIAYFLSVPLVLGTYSFAANKVFDGIVTDDMCGRKHTMIPGKPDSECVRACVKAGSKHALLVGDKVYKLGNKTELADKLAGQKVKITGDLVDNSIRVDVITPEK